MVRLRLNNPLDFIPTNVDKETGVFQLVEHAEREGCLDDLLRALHEDKPGNKKVQRLAPPAPRLATDDSGLKQQRPSARAAIGILHLSDFHFKQGDKHEVLR